MKVNMSYLQEFMERLKEKEKDYSISQTSLKMYIMSEFGMDQRTYHKYKNLLLDFGLIRIERGTQNAIIRTELWQTKRGE